MAYGELGVEGAYGSFGPLRGSEHRFARGGQCHPGGGEAQPAIRAMYAQVAQRVGEIDAVASAAGSVPWRPLGELTTDDIRGGLEGKAVSQIELVRQGARHLPAHASYTLVTGILAREPLLTGSVAALVNGAVEAFVRAAAVGLPGRQRINAVSPTVFEESLDAYGDTFAGFDAVPVARAANAYVKSVEGHRTGQIFLVE